MTQAFASEKRMKDSACVADNAVPLTDICRMAAGRTEKHAPIWGFQQVGGVMAPLYHHKSKAEKMADRVPPLALRKR